MLLQAQREKLNNNLKVILASQSPRRQELLSQLVGITKFRVVVSDFAEDLDKSQFASAEDYCQATAMGKAKDVLAKLARETETKAETESEVAERKESSTSLTSITTTTNWDIVICADTIVVGARTSNASGTDNDSTTTPAVAPFEIFEKAPTPNDAFKMIKQLQGTEHEVITVLLVIFNGRTFGAERAPLKESAPTSVLEGEGEEKVGNAEPHAAPIFAIHNELVRVKMAALSDAHIREYVSLNEAAWRGKAGAYGIQDTAATFIEAIYGDYYTVMGLPVHRLTKMLADKVSDL